VRGADGRRERPSIFGAPRLPATARGWAADTVSGAPRPYTRRQIRELARLGIDVEGYPADLVDGIYRAAMLDQRTVLDGAQRMAELVADTNDDYEGETVPSDPDREAAFAEMVAAAEREIAAETWMKITGTTSRRSAPSGDFPLGQGRARTRRP
jgi:hypothetical protein